MRALDTRRETYAAGDRGRTGDWVRGAVATLYAAGMIYAGGLKFLLLSALLYAPGTILYYFARREQKAVLFAPAEMIVFGALCIAALAALVALISGALSI